MLLNLLVLILVIFQLILPDLVPKLTSMLLLVMFRWWYWKSLFLQLMWILPVSVCTKELAN